MREKNMLRLLFAVAVCLAGLPLEGQGSDLIIRLSESEALNTSSQVDWHTEAGQGWYIKEHYHAEDFAFMVCDAQSAGAALVFDLGHEISPGPWRIFVRHIRNRSGGTNVLGLALGNLNAAGKFTAGGAADMAWSDQDQPRDYRWAEAAITIGASCRYLQVAAKQVARKGIGDVPEYPLAVLLLDTLVVTDSREVRLDKGAGGRHPNRLILPGRDAPDTQAAAGSSERSQVWWLALAADEPVRGAGGAKERTAGSAAAAAPCPPGNRLKGGGFDAALNPYWFIPVQNGYYATADLLDDVRPAHGPRCLRLKGYSSPYAAKPDFGAMLVSAPFALAPGQYRCSWMARSDDPGVKLDLAITVFDPDAVQLAQGQILGAARGVRPTSEWSRVETNLDIRAPVHAQVQIKANGFGGAPDRRGLSPGAVWLDAFSLSETNNVFEPALPVEFGLFTKGLRLFHVGDLEFLVRVVAYDRRATATLEYEVLDLEWRPIRQGALTVALNERGIGEKAFGLPFKNKRGAYLIRARVAGLPATTQVLDFAVVDDPARNPAAPNLGLYTHFNPAQADYFRRAGARYALTLCDRIFRGSVALPAKVELKDPNSEAEILTTLDSAPCAWFDEVIRGWIAKGFEVIPEFLAYEMPAWAKGRPAAFGRYAGKSARHYKELGIKRWITGDEVGDAYRPYHEAAVQAIRAEIPDARFMLSACPGVIEAWAERGDVGTAAVGGSYWGATKWHYHVERETSLRLKKPFWNIGVGWGSRPIYLGDPRSIHMNMGRGRFDVVANVLFCQAIAAPDLLVTYCNRFTNGRAFGTGDMLTGTFVPHGVGFAAAAGFVRGATPGGELDLANASDLDAFWFTRGGRIMAVVCQAQAFWGSHRGEAAFRLRIEADPAKLGFYNVDLAEVEAPARQGQSFAWELPALGLLALEDRGLGQAALLKAVTELTAVKTHETRYVILGRDDGGLDLGLWLKNGLERDLSGNLALEERVALAQSASRSVRLDLGAGTGKLVRFALAPKMGLNRPIGNFIAGYTFSDNATFALGDEAHLWMACAGQRQADPPLRGRAGWDAKELAGYVMGSGRLGGGYGFEQVRKGGTWFVAAETREMGLRLFARWSAARIQFGFDLDEAMAQTCRSLDIMLDPGLADTLAGRSPAHQPRTITIAGLEASPRIVMDEIEKGAPRGRPANLAGADLKVERQGKRLFVELSLPAAAALGHVPMPGESVGFNVLARGPNFQTGAEMEFVFSGRPNFRPFDPDGWGQLVFLGGR